MPTFYSYPFSLLITAYRYASYYKCRVVIVYDGKWLLICIFYPSGDIGLKSRRCPVRVMCIARAAGEENEDFDEPEECSMRYGLYKAVKYALNLIGYT